MALATRQSAESHVSVFVCGGAAIAGRPLYREIVDRAREAGLSGVTATQGLCGFGAAGVIRWPGLFGPNGFAPVRVDIADQPDRVAAFLPEIEQLDGIALIVIKTVAVTRRVGDGPNVAATAAR